MGKPFKEGARYSPAGRVPERPMRKHIPDRPDTNPPLEGNERVDVMTMTNNDLDIPEHCWVPRSKPRHLREQKIPVDWGTMPRGG